MKSVFKFNFDLDNSLKNFFQGVSDKISEVNKIIQEEREKHKNRKLQEIEKENKERRQKLILDQENQLKSKEQELREEIKLEKERKKELQKFIRLNKQK